MKKIAITLIFLISIVFILYANKNNIMKIFYPITYSEYVHKYSNEYNIDEYLIYACIKAESNFNEEVESNKGAKGLMQLMPSTAKEVAQGMNLQIEDKDIINPETNIKLGTKYISKLASKNNSIELALAAYNAGSGKVDSWIADGTLKPDGSDIENIPFKETNNYVRKILKDYKIYKKLYDSSYVEG